MRDASRYGANPCANPCYPSLDRAVKTPEFGRAGTPNGCCRGKFDIGILFSLPLTCVLIARDHLPLRFRKQVVKSGDKYSQLQLIASFLACSTTSLGFEDLFRRRGPDKCFSPDVRAVVNAPST